MRLETIFHREELSDLGREVSFIRRQRKVNGVGIASHGIIILHTHFDRIMPR